MRTRAKNRMTPQFEPVVATFAAHLARVRRRREEGPSRWSFDRLGVQIISMGVKLTSGKQ